MWPGGRWEDEEDGGGGELQLAATVSSPTPTVPLPPIDARTAGQTFWNVVFAFAKSSSAKNRPSPPLCTLFQLFASRSNSGANSRHSWQPIRASRAVSRTTAVKFRDPVVSSS